MSSNPLQKYELAEKLYISWAQAEAAFRIKRLPKIQDDEITLAQFEMLIALHLLDKSEVTVKELAEILLKSSSAITQLVASLEEIDFVKRRRSTKDRRQVYIETTKDGNKKFKKVYKSLIDSLTDFIEGLDDNKINNYIEMNKEIAERM